jgi:nucleotide-binding universal stress UspA family protein
MLFYKGNIRIWRLISNWGGAFMYQKILVPLDGSKEAEKVVSLIKDEVAPDGTIAMLRVIPPAKTQNLGGHTILSTDQEESNRYDAIDYLKEVARQQDFDPERRLCEAVVASSVSDCIVDFASREGVDLIAMYIHDRNLLVRPIIKSVAREVQRKASTEVRVFGTKELESYTLATAGD